MYDLAAATQMIFEWCVRQLSYKAFSDTGGKAIAAGRWSIERKAIDKIRHNGITVGYPRIHWGPGSCVGAVLAHTKTKIVPYLTKHGIRKYNIV